MGSVTVNRWSVATTTTVTQHQRFRHCFPLARLQNGVFHHSISMCSPAECRGYIGAPKSKPKRPSMAIEPILLQGETVHLVIVCPGGTVYDDIDGLGDRPCRHKQSGGDRLLHDRGSVVRRQQSNRKVIQTPQV